MTAFVGATDAVSRCGPCSNRPTNGAKEAPDDPVIVRVQGQPITEKRRFSTRSARIAQSGQRTAEQLQKKRRRLFSRIAVRKT